MCYDHGEIAAKLKLFHTGSPIKEVFLLVILLFHNELV